MMSLQSPELKIWASRCACRRHASPGVERRAAMYTLHVSYNLQVHFVTDTMYN